MILFHQLRQYEVKQAGTDEAPSYFAFTLCWCGSAMSSGEGYPTIKEAVLQAADSLENHNREGKHAKPLV